MTRFTKKSIDINSVLVVLNLLVAGLIVYGIPDARTNPYIDQETMGLGLLLSLETHLALRLERGRRDPFVILLAFTTIFFFSLRLFTLTVFQYSVVFDSRYSYGPEDSNYALVFIIVANLFLYAGFFAVKFEKNKVIDSSGWRPTSAARIIALMLASIIYSYVSGIYSTPEEQPRIASVMGVFVSPPIILLMALAYFTLFRNSLNRTAAYAIAALIVLEIIAHTLSGSRSGIATLVQNVMVAILGISSCIKFERKIFIVGCALAPLALGLLIGTFVVSTYNRSQRDAGVSLNLLQAVELTGEARRAIGAETGLDIILPPIFDRAGFFDYSAEIIAHREQYKEVFNLSSYAKSIVDNLLTPGFDVYDQPKIANALQFVYENLGTPSKEMVTETYQSDQFGIYGELYALFGYASLPLFFAMAFFLKRLYVRLKSTSPFFFAMKRIVVLAAFVKIIDSYGMDWTIIEMVPFVAAIFLYTFFFRSRRVAQRVLVTAAPE